MANSNLNAWFGLRKKAIHDRVTVHDILKRNGVSFRHVADREEQFSCPFHGKDEKPSARAFPSTPQSPSHVWCFVCRERWDAIGLWKKYSGEEKKFHQILSEIEKAYNIVPPPIPEGGLIDAPSADDTAKARFDTLYELCESRLKDAREVYVAKNDSNGYLIAGSMLDKIYSKTSVGQLTYPKANELLRQLIDKIGGRIRVQENQAAHP